MKRHLLLIDGTGLIFRAYFSIKGDMTTPARALAQQVLDRAKARGVMVATAESCTGGLVSAALTEIAGSSA